MLFVLLSKLEIWIPLVLLGVMAQIAFANEPAQTAEPTTPGVDRFVMGAYFAWERSGGLAEYRGVDRWQDVTDRLDRLAENSIDTLWVVNLSDADFPRLIQECEKRRIALIPALSSIEPRNWAADHKDKEQAYCDTVVPRVVEMAGDSKTVIGWALGDEPFNEMLSHIELLRAKFEAVDPKRFPVTVNVWTQIPQLVPRNPKLPVYCVDLYPFYGDNSVSGPHTDITSQAFFRSNADILVSTAGASRNSWIMGQCYAEARGPRRYDDRGNMIALPGAYVIWRCPTLAEMRWQVWETVRSGADGSIMFVASPHVPDASFETLPPANDEAAWKDSLVAEPTDMGPTALLTPDASATEQLIELGKTYRILRPLSDVMLRWRAAPGIKIDVAAPVTSACFVDPVTGEKYLVLVNDDLHKPAEARFRLPASFKAAEKVIDPDGPEMKTEGSWVVVRLDAGAGAICVLRANAGM